MNLPLILGFCAGGAVVALLNVIVWAILHHRAQRPAVQAPALCFVRTWKPTTPEQWAHAFREWPESDPRWRALWDLLAHHLEAELGEAQGAPPDPHAIVQRSGRMQMLLFLRAQILNLRGKA